MNKPILLTSALFLFIALLLVGCITVKKPTAPTSPEKVSLQAFFDAGCHEVEAPYIIDCADAKFAKKFNCDDILYISKNGKDFGLPLVGCNALAWSQDKQLISEEELKNYFRCGGGFIVTCLSYITYKDNRFIQIKNKEELLSHVGVIDTEDKALALVLLSKGGSEELIVNENKLRGRNVEVVGQNFLVTVYSSDETFGCYDEINYKAIKYEVTSNGDITEKSNEVVFNKQLDETNCVD